MVAPEFSEFTYGFALTYELVNLSGLPLIFVPVFPSLIREGSPGGGYDVEIPTGSSTGLFLQFKTCEQIIRRRANIREVADGMNTPFLRLPLRKERSYSQHDQLVRLESAGAYVAYVGPAFVETAVLTESFYKKETVYKSVWVRPSEIPSSFDRTARHWMSFDRKPPFRWDFYSEAVEHRRRDADFETFLGNLGKVTDSQPGNSREALNYYLRIRDVLKEMVQENIVGLGSWEESVYHVVDAEPNLLRQIAFLAQTALDSSFLLASRRGPPQS